MAPTANRNDVKMNWNLSFLRTACVCVCARERNDKFFFYLLREYENVRKCVARWENEKKKKKTKIIYFKINKL